MNKGSAVVLLSGGQDSTTCLFWAKEHFDTIHALCIDYGQRHASEVESARKVAEMAGVPIEVIKVQEVLKSTSPLISKDNRLAEYASVNDLPGGVEATFVPFRNPFFLIIAANYAVSVGANHLVTGICEEDYGGYPDCRESFRDSMQAVLNQALHGHNGNVEGIFVHAPLMKLDKAGTVRMAQRLPGAMDALAFTTTSYSGQYPPNPNDHASLLRARGFHQAGIPDPLIVRAKKEGKLDKDYPDSGLVEGTRFAKQADDQTQPKTVESKQPAKAKQPAPQIEPAKDQ